MEAGLVAECDQALRANVEVVRPLKGDGTSWWTRRCTTSHVARDSPPAAASHRLLRGRGGALVETVGFAHVRHSSRCPFPLPPPPPVMTWSGRRGAGGHRPRHRLGSPTPLLVAAGVLHSPDDVLFAELREVQYAYVVFDHHYYDALAKLMPFLEGHGIYPRGRYGSWTYNSMEDCMMLGRDIGALLRWRVLGRRSNPPGALGSAGDKT